MNCKVGHTNYAPGAIDNVHETGLNKPAELSVREREILIMIADGLSAKQIAARLGITTKTVEYHKYRLCKTVGRSGTAALVRYAILSGIIEA